MDQDNLQQPVDLQLQENNSKKALKFWIATALLVLIPILLLYHLFQTISHSSEPAYGLAQILVAVGMVYFPILLFVLSLAMYYSLKKSFKKVVFGWIIIIALITLVYFVIQNINLKNLKEACKENLQADTRCQELFGYSSNLNQAQKNDTQHILDDFEQLDYTSYSNELYSFMFPKDWVISYTGYPAKNPTSCGEAWKNATRCIKLDPKILADEALGTVTIFEFKTNISTLDWCESNNSIFLDCTKVPSSNGRETVLSSSPNGETLKQHYTIYGNGKTIVVFKIENIKYFIEEGYITKYFLFKS